MNWFKRHLNWTIAFAWIAPCFVLFALGVAVETLPREACVGYVVGFGGPLLFLVVGLLGLWVSLWVLGQKNRSAWWMLFLWLPFGFVVLLALDNHSRQSGVV